MTPEELLKPRYKCIADYPCAIHKVGDIIETYESAMSYSVELSGITEKICLKDYPILFQKLEWWQERSHEELPDYVKRIHNGKLFVYKKEYWGNSEESKGIKYTTSDGISLLNYIGTCEIATLEEYNAYQSSIKDTTLTNKIK